MRKLLMIICIALLPFTIFPCTTAIVSGNATVDGRPLLWKHRDTNFFQNKIMFFNDGKYPYLGLVNAADVDGEEIWAGVNAAGFAIMNSASYNLKPDDDTTSIKDREGIVMKLALQQCATIEDFEALLRELPKPLGVETNFGVIDASGGAAYYETDNFTFIKFDVNDPDIAPNGYIIRSNFSYSGAVDEGHGYIRHDTATELFEQRRKTEKFTAEFILTEATRSLKHSRTRIDLYGHKLQPAGMTQFNYFRDFIPRFTSTSSIVVRGVKPGESPGLSAMFTILGFPLTSVTVPLLMAGEELFPDFLKANESEVAPLSDASLRLKAECFPILKGSGRDYIDLNILLNEEETGVLQLIPEVEREIFSMESEFFKSIVRDGIYQSKIVAFYAEIERIVEEFYEKNFELLLR